MHFTNVKKMYLSAFIAIIFNNLDNYVFVEKTFEA